MIDRSEFMGHGRRLTTALAGMAALAATTLGVASAASAAGPTGTGGTTGGGGTPPTLATPPAALHPTVVPFAAAASDYLAGYQVTPAGGLASAGLTFTVPKISCNATDKADDAQMYDGVYTDSFNSYALVDSYCTSTGPAAELLVETPYGQYTAGAAAGDTVVTSLYQSGTDTEAEVHDLTSGGYVYSELYSDVGDTVIDIGSYSVAFADEPVPTFTKIVFSGATLNGDDLGFSSVGASEYNVLNGGDLLIKTGKLTTTGAGSSFSLTFKHAS